MSTPVKSRVAAILLPALTGCGGGGDSGGTVVVPTAPVNISAATTFDCLVNGTATVSGNIADPALDTLTAGDLSNGTQG
jgi:hypothetical protein